VKLEDAVECKRMWKKTKVMGISRQQSPVQIMMAEKHPENVEYFNCFGSMITNYARCSREIKSMIIMEKQRSTRRRVFSPANCPYM
jgi:hypothetical protein